MIVIHRVLPIGLSDSRENPSPHGYARGDPRRTTMNRTFARICSLIFLGLFSTFLLSPGVSASPADTEIRHESIQLKRVGP